MGGQALNSPFKEISSDVSLGVAFLMFFFKAHPDLLRTQTQFAK
jgi:hypothetical protein